MSSCFSPSDGIRSASILIVDDDATTNQFLKYTLTHEGFETYSAFGVADALMRIREAKPDLVLLDANLPDGTGFDVCRELQNGPGGIPMPILFISANEDTSSKVKALEAGAVDYISKPIAPTEVIARVRTHLRLRHVTEKLNEVHEREQKLQRLIDAAHDAIITMDPKGRISYYNRAAELLFGWSSDEILGADLHRALVPERDASSFKKGMGEFRETGGGPAIGTPLELTAKHKDGHEFPVEISVASAKADDGWSAIAIVRDLRKRKTLA